MPKRCTVLSPYKLYQHLHELLIKLGVSVRTEPFDPKLFTGTTARGGLCRVGTKWVVLVDARASITERVGVLAHAAATFDYDRYFVPPAVREVVDNHRRTAEARVSSSKERATGGRAAASSRGAEPRRLRVIPGRR